jgi:hypothetical protein
VVTEGAAGDAMIDRQIYTTRLDEPDAAEPRRISRGDD